MSECPHLMYLSIISLANSSHGTCQFDILYLSNKPFHLITDPDFIFPLNRNVFQLIFFVSAPMIWLICTFSIPMSQTSVEKKNPKMFLFVLPKLSWHIIFMEPCVQKQLLESGFNTIAYNIKQTFKNRKRHQSCFGEN